ncbi:hypothetical protein ThrDRAFT_04615 [Frankia casuarinae]|nr:hypothetical protein ThrDRAFT_04615 [Frankia casuarinae]KDA40565.1 hypothetical protein BMG523Draft_04624 [Frankia sp. BMG5.23]
MAQCAWASSASSLGLAWCVGRLVTAWTVSAVAGPPGQGPAVADDPDGLDRVGEADPGADLGGLHGPAFDAAVAAASRPRRGADLRPAQGRQLGQQRRPVRLHNQQVVRSVVDEPGRGVVLGVQRVLW